METLTKTQFIEAFATSREVYFVVSKFSSTDLLELPEFEKIIKACTLSGDDLRHYKRSTTTRIYFDNNSVLDMAQVAKVRKYLKFYNYYIFQYMDQDSYYQTKDNPRGEAFTTIIYKINL